MNETIQWSDFTKVDMRIVTIIEVKDFLKAQIVNFMSECLILSAVENDDIVLLQLSFNIPNGLKIS